MLFGFLDKGENFIGDFHFFICVHWDGLFKYNRFNPGVEVPGVEKKARLKQSGSLGFPMKRKR